MQNFLCVYLTFPRILAYGCTQRKKNIMGNLLLFVRFLAKRLFFMPVIERQPKCVIPYFDIRRFDYTQWPKMPKCGIHIFQCPADRNISNENKSFKNVILFDLCLFVWFLAKRLFFMPVIERQPKCGIPYFDIRRFGYAQRPDTAYRRSALRFYNAHEKCTDAINEVTPKSWTKNFGGWHYITI